MGNFYRIKVTDNNDLSKNIEFDYLIHDELLGLIELTRKPLGLTEEKHNAFMIGLKLMGEVLIEERKNYLFKDFFPQFKEFMHLIKKQCK